MRKRGCGPCTCTRGTIVQPTRVFVLVVQHEGWASACSASRRRCGVRFLLDWCNGVRDDQLFNVPVALCCRHDDVQPQSDPTCTVRQYLWYSSRNAFQTLLLDYCYRYSTRVGVGVLYWSPPVQTTIVPLVQRLQGLLLVSIGPGKIFNQRHVYL